MYYVYILSNRWHSVFYTGMTNDIHRRLFEHKNKIFKDSFTKRFNVDHILYGEEQPTWEAAINREQEIKKVHRQYRIQLIEKLNPGLVDPAAGWTS